MFTKIDLTKNETPGYIIEGYPTITLFSGQKEGLRFDDELDAKHLRKFIEKNRITKAPKIVKTDL